MTTTTAIAIFFLIWWVTLFAVLPWGVRSQHEAGGSEGGADVQDGAQDAPGIVPGTDPGAPTEFRLGRKLLWTTLVSGVIYACAYVVYVERLVTVDGLMATFSNSDKKIQ
jgi:predicted secreted protein